MLLLLQKLPTSYYLFYNTLDANDTANDCRKRIITFFNNQFTDALLWSRNYIFLKYLTENINEIDKKLEKCI